VSRISGSRTNEGLKGSDVGTRSQDEVDTESWQPYSSQELRRRKFFERTEHSKRPALHRRNASPNLPPKPVTAVVETVVDLIRDGRFKNDFRASDPLAPTIPSIPTPPAVPKFPNYSSPTVPTVPAYPFNSQSSQSILSSPPSSPAPSDASFTTTTIQTSSAPPGSAGSSGSSTSDAVKTATASSTLNVSYSNSTSTSTTRSNLTASTSLIASSQKTTLSTRVSTSSPEVTSSGGTAGVAATFTGTGSAPASITTSSSASDSGSASDSSNNPVGPNTPQVVGGVVGGIAGLAIILLVVLFFLRRYRRQLQDRGELLEQDTTERDNANTMSMRSSHTPLMAAVTASLKKIRPGSSHTTATGDTGTSERGFQRVAGRKIAPVLTTGGDGFGGNYGAFEKDALVDKETGAPSSSQGYPAFYDRQGSATYLPAGTQPRSRGDNRDFADGHDDEYNRGPSPDAIAVMRPSPARSLVTTSAGPTHLAPHQSGPAMASDAPPTPTLLARFAPDGVGRSLISQDGSRGSRFTESV
jgi:hypothetical protein